MTDNTNQKKSSWQSNWENTPNAQKGRIIGKLIIISLFLIFSLGFYIYDNVKKN